MMMTLWLGGDANVTQPVVATIVNTRFLKRKYIVFRMEYLSGYLELKYHMIKKISTLFSFE